MPFCVSYGTLYKLDRRTGAVLQAGDQIKPPKHRAGVFSTTCDSDTATFDDACLAGDGGAGGDGDGGGDGGD